MNDDSQSQKFNDGEKAGLKFNRSTHQRYSKLDAKGAQALKISGASMNLGGRKVVSYLCGALQVLQIGRSY